MADDIPPDLLDLQRQHTAAVAESTRAREAGEDVGPALAEERRLALALHRMREGTPWAAWPAQKRVREAAAGE